jgi:pilus assembly protein CpaC
MDACEVPPNCLGKNSQSPSDCELFMKGQLEVPRCCPSEEPCNSCEPRVEQGTLPKEPKDGMILGPGEQIPAPMPTETSGRPKRTAPGVSVASRQTELSTAPVPASEPKKPYSRYTSSKPNTTNETSHPGTQQGPPGFIGPVGYDVVK